MTQEEFRKRYQFDIKTNNIGGGSFGTVYKAYDTILDREVAIKVSEVKTFGDKEFSLLEEFKAIESLTEHQNIANYERVYRFESFPATYDYAIMQYYPLGNLSHYLKNNDVNQEKRERLVEGILEGIAFLHKHNVVHRDLKPSNILVVDRKGKLIPKITDFGLSKQADVDAKGSRFTNSFAGGTLQYSSPEQLKGLPLKLNTDLWSFGAIAYEILTNKTLFEANVEGTASAEWQNAITQKILHQDINSELKDLPENWHYVLKVCLEKDLSKRVQNTDVLLALLNGKSLIQATNPTPVSKDTPLITNDTTVIKEGNTQKNKHQPYSPTGKTKTLSKKKGFKEEYLSYIITAAIFLLVVAGYFIFTKDNQRPKEQNLIVFKDGNLYGYKKSDQVIIKPQFLSANAFKNDSAQVAVKDSSYIINAKGEWLTTLTDSTKYHKDKLEEVNKNALALDKKAWQAAKRNNSIVAYQSYLQDYKNGQYIKSAQKAIYDLRNPSKPDKIIVVEDKKTSKKANKTDKSSEDTEVPFSVIETVPLFPGCSSSGTNSQKKACMSNAITKHVQDNYNTDLSGDLGLSAGKKIIYVQFKISKNGNIINIRTRGPHPVLEAEAVRVISLLPKMTPGTQRGKTVIVKYALPITFNVID